MSISELDDNPEEVIDNYFKCLDNDDRNWSIKDELNNRNELKMHCLLDGTLEKLEKNKMGKQSLQGIHTYDILRNPDYINKF